MEEDLDVSGIDGLPLLDPLLPVHLFVVVEVESERIAVVVEAEDAGLGGRQAGEGHGAALIPGGPGPSRGGGRGGGVQGVAGGGLGGLGSEARALAAPGCGKASPGRADRPPRRARRKASKNVKKVSKDRIGQNRQDRTKRAAQKSVQFLCLVFVPGGQGQARNI